MAYMSIIVLISIVFYMTSSLKNKQVPFIIFAISGILVLFLASFLYNSKMPGIYNSNLFLNLRYIYKFANNIKISFVQIYRMMHIGVFLILLSCISMSFAMIKKIKKRYFFATLLPIYIYLFINDFELSIYFHIQKSKGIIISYFLEMINIYNISLIFMYFIFPVIAIWIYYKKTTFIIKKKHAIFMLIYTLMYYVLIVVMHYIGIIRFFQINNISIFRFTAPTVSDFKLSFVLALISVIIFAIVLLVVKTGRMQNYSTNALKKNTAEIDKNLRMILHTYKNHFFAINQQITFLKSLDEEYSEKVQHVFDAIEEVSKTSVDEISDRINALKNVKMGYKPVDINMCIEKAVEKSFIPQNIKIIKEYAQEQVIVYSESSYLIEMIANLVQNSVEAITSKVDTDTVFEIRIKTAAESDWILLEVEDNGCGIAEKEKKRIFEPLVSGKQGKNNFGMGLHYVQKVVAAHNGYIFLDSVPGKYTKFQIYLQKNNIETLVNIGESRGGNT